MSSAPYLPPETAPPPVSVWKSALTRKVFSFPVMCMFLLIAAVFGFSVKSISEPDIWWHLRNGQQIVLHHTIPRVDTYSFGAAGSPWLDHEWMSEVPFFLAFRAAGLQGILVVYFVVLVLIYAGVYYRSCDSGADCKDATLTTLAALCLGVVSIGPRMLLFGWLCMVGLLLVLDRFRQTGKGLWLLPPLFALWINLHGSWIFGMVVLGLTVASGLVEGEWGLVVGRRWTPTELMRLLAASAASVAALFINPFGYKLVLYPFDLLFRQQSNLKYIQEWQSVDFSTGNGKGPHADLGIAGGGIVFRAAMEGRRDNIDHIRSVGRVVPFAPRVFCGSHHTSGTCPMSETVSTLRPGHRQTLVECRNYGCGGRRNHLLLSNHG